MISIIDLRGKKTGYDFLKIISENNLNLEFIIHSNRHFQNDIEHASEFGIKIFTPKLLRPDDLIDLIIGESPA